MCDTTTIILPTIGVKWRFQCRWRTGWRLILEPLTSSGNVTNKNWCSNFSKNSVAGLRIWDSRCENDPLCWRELLSRGKKGLADYEIWEVILHPPARRVNCVTFYP